MSSTAVKQGCPSELELECLSKELGTKWEELARRFRFETAKIEEINTRYERLDEKALEMLLDWSEESDGTYQVLYDGLCHKFVACKMIAEKFCWNNNNKHHATKTITKLQGWCYLYNYNIEPGFNLDFIQNYYLSQNGRIFSVCEGACKRATAFIEFPLAPGLEKEIREKCQRAKKKRD